MDTDRQYFLGPDLRKFQVPMRLWQPCDYGRIHCCHHGLPYCSSHEDTVFESHISLPKVLTWLHVHPASDFDNKLIT